MKQTGGREYKSFGKQLHEYRYLLLMLFFPVAYVIIFNYIPMGGAILAFKDYNYRGGFLGSAWNGIENFRFFFISGSAWTVTRNTLLYNLAFIVMGLAVQVTFAILLSELAGKWFKKIAQTGMLLPFFISWVVASAFFYNIFSYEYGIMNNVLKLFGMNPFNVYDKPFLWPFLLVVMHLWKSAGYGTIIYLAAISGIDQQMYEAADIDGASVWQRIRCITLPSITSTMMIMFLLGLGQIFRGDIGMFYQLVGNNAVILPTTDIIDTFVFRALLSTSDIGMTAAAGLYQSVMCFFTILIANNIVKRIFPDYSLF